MTENMQFQLGQSVLYKDKVVKVLGHKGETVRIQDNGREFQVNQSTLSVVPEDANITSKNKIGVGTVIPKEVRKQYKVHKTKTAGGSYAIDNDDNIAATLRGMPIEDVYKVAAAEIAKHGGSTTVAELKAKYTHLNLGMQRMNLGNLIRGAAVKVETEKKKAAAKAAREQAKADKPKAEPKPEKAKPEKAKPEKAKAEPAPAPAKVEKPKAKGAAKVPAHA